jgi:hypothetical protein
LNVSLEAVSRKRNLIRGVSNASEQALSLPVKGSVPERQWWISEADRYYHLPHRIHFHLPIIANPSQNSNFVEFLQVIQQVCPGIVEQVGCSELQQVQSIEEPECLSPLGQLSSNRYLPGT